MSRSFPSLDVTVRELEPAALKRELDSGAEYTLLDTRKPADYQAWHITHPNLTAVNIPFTEFLDESGEVPADSLPENLPGGTLVTCCAKGLSSRYVAEFLVKHDRDAIALADGMEGWARVHECHEIERAEGTVLQCQRPSSGCLAHLFVSGTEAAVVDPLRAFAGQYAELADAYGATLKYAIDTHVHADHVSGVREVARESGAEVVIPTGARDRGLAFDATVIAAGDTLALGDEIITARGLAGHTNEMLGYRFGGVLASGDTVFLDGVARPDLEAENDSRAAAATLWETLQSLTDLPEDTIIAPAHAGPTTVPAADGTYTARLGNLLYQLGAFGESREAFVERILGDLPPRPANDETIIAINLGRDTADSDEAFELELGPNNCAVEG